VKSVTKSRSTMTTSSLIHALIFQLACHGRLMIMLERVLPIPTMTVKSAQSPNTGAGNMDGVLILRPFAILGSMQI
jgi:hypothetical protein